MSRPTPTAEGTFAKTPCAHVLLYIRERALSGTLMVFSNEGKALFAFDKGQLSQARLKPTDITGGATPDRLGEVLLDLRLVAPEAVQASVARISRGEALQGQILVENGDCDARAVEIGLREQLLRKAARIFSGELGDSYAFYADTDLVGRFGAERFPVDVLGVVWRGVRRGRPDHSFDKVLARATGGFIRLRSNAEIRSFGFEQDAMALLEPTRSGINTDHLISRATDQELARKILYVLLLTKSIDVRPPGSVTAGAPAAAETAIPAAPVVPAAARRPSIPPPPALQTEAPRVAPRAPAVEARAPRAPNEAAAAMVDLPLPPLPSPAERPAPASDDIKLPSTVKPFAMGRSPLFDRVIERARRVQATDLHLVAGRPPLYRVVGDLVPDGDVLEASIAEAMIMPLVPDVVRPRLQSEGSCDFGMEHEKFGRFRVNVSQQRTGLKACLRLIPDQLPTLASLGLPEAIARATHHHQGLIVVTGPTGHGKTSTLTAIINLINHQSTHHVITVEDPVEYVHPRSRALMSQREVGSHTNSFAAALKASLREDPDVIAIGELRDTETVRMALAASETGHLVIATMNTPSAAKTIDRLIDLFPPADQPQVRATLAGGLRLIVSQRLVPRADRTGMAAAVELLPGSIALWTLIRDGKTYQIPSLQQRGKGLGIIRLDDSLLALVREGVVKAEDARVLAENPEDFDIALDPSRSPEALAEAAKAAKDPGLLSRAGSLFGKKG